MPLVFEAGAAGAGGGDGGDATTDKNFQAQVVARVLGTPGCAELLRPNAEEYEPLESCLEGVPDELFSATWAAAAANGFHHVLDGREVFLAPPLHLPRIYTASPLHLLCASTAPPLHLPRSSCSTRTSPSSTTRAP